MNFVRDQRVIYIHTTKSGNRYYKPATFIHNYTEWPAVRIKLDDGESVVKPDQVISVEQHEAEKALAVRQQFETGYMAVVDDWNNPATTDRTKSSIAKKHQMSVGKLNRILMNAEGYGLLVVPRLRKAKDDYESNSPAASKDKD